MLDTIERRVRQEVERPRPPEIDAVVLEALTLEVTAVERHRFGAELQEQASEPRLEQRGAHSRLRRPAGVRSRGDVENALATYTLERAERALKPADELVEDLRELRLVRDLAAQVVLLVEPLEDRVVHYRGQVPHSPEPSHDDLLRIYAQPKTIAVVGASDRAGSPAHDIPRYLQSQGYGIVPVNPRGGEILGERAFPTLRAVDVTIDIVDVFRPPAEAETIARDAIAVGARFLWFQPGTESEEALRVARDAGLTVVARRCMGVTHGLLGLGPGPHARR